MASSSKTTTNEHNMRKQHYRNNLPNVLAKPKSHSFTTPEFDIKMFSGLTSLWITYKQITTTI